MVHIPTYARTLMYSVPPICSHTETHRPTRRYTHPCHRQMQARVLAQPSPLPYTGSYGFESTDLHTHTELSHHDRLHNRTHSTYLKHLPGSLVENKFFSLSRFSSLNVVPISIYEMTPKKDQEPRKGNESEPDRCWLPCNAGDAVTARLQKHTGQGD